MKLKHIFTKTVMSIGVMGTTMTLFTLPASATPHTQGGFCSSTSTPCLRVWDDVTIPSSGGTMEFNVYVRMKSDGMYYCPYKYGTAQNNTTRTQSIDSVRIVWTDTSNVQHTTISTNVGAYGGPGSTIYGGGKTPWSDGDPLGSCNLWIPTHQSDTRNTHTRANGVWYYGHNSAQTWARSLDLP